MNPHRPLREFLDDLVASGAVSAVVGLMGTAAEVVVMESSGWARTARQVPAGTGTRFDLASLTKPFTATLAMALDRRGLLPLDSRVGKIWNQAVPRLGVRSLADLLRHRAGFIPWTPLYHRCRDGREALDLLLGGELLGVPAGVYSDLGYILWGLTVERMLGEPLAYLLRREVLDPLEIRGVGPSPGDRRGVAECLLDGSREVELAAQQGLEVELAPPPGPGIAQDGNARFLGGCPGHAGLFGAAHAVWRLAREWLAPGAVLDPDRVSWALGGRFLMGWRRRRETAGTSLSRQAYGHTGFTGGSVWIDPTKERIYVLLAHRTSAAVELGSWRRRFHALMAASARG